MNDIPSANATVAMLIRKPVTEAFEAFVNPEITINFWFTASTGKLEKGKEVTWIWEMYGHKLAVTVVDLIASQRGALDFMGIVFHYPEKEVTGIQWLGRGPYHVWKNRLKGLKFGIWENAYNNPNVDDR